MSLLTLPTELLLALTGHLDASTIAELQLTCQYMRQFVLKYNYLIFHHRVLENWTHSSLYSPRIGLEYLTALTDQRAGEWLTFALRQERIQRTVESKYCLHLTLSEFEHVVTNEIPASFGPVQFSLCDFGATFHFTVGPSGKVCFATDADFSPMYVLDFDQRTISSGYSSGLELKDGDTLDRFTLQTNIPTEDPLKWILSHGSNRSTKPAEGSLFYAHSILAAGVVCSSSIVNTIPQKYKVEVSFADSRANYTVSTEDCGVFTSLYSNSNLSKRWVACITSQLDLCVFDASNGELYYKEKFTPPVLPSFYAPPHMPYSRTSYRQFNQIGPYLLYLQPSYRTDSYTLFAWKICSHSLKEDKKQDWYPVVNLPPGTSWQWSGECHVDDDRYLKLMGQSNRRDQPSVYLVVVDLVAPWMSRCYRAEVVCACDELYSDIDDSTDDEANEEHENRECECHLGAWVVDKSGSAIWYSKEYSFAITNILSEEATHDEEHVLDDGIAVPLYDALHENIATL